MSVWGPFLLGVMFNIGLEGFAHYWDTFRTDKTWVRLFVLYLFILETLNTAFGIAIVWEPFMTNTDDHEGTKLGLATPAAMTFFPTSFVTTLISTPMQIFVAWRIYAGTRSLWLPFVITICADRFNRRRRTGRGVTVIIVKTFLRKEEVNHPSIVWSSFTTAADVFMTIGLTYILIVNRKKNPSNARGFSKAIQRNLFNLLASPVSSPAIFALLDVVLFTTQPENTINFVWDFGLSKLYTNILISTMNARAAPASVNVVGNIHNALFGDDTGPYSITKSGAVRLFPSRAIP
ncbi:hypothetical protein B0H14DRAFT_2983294, partial [Mycena olivaceomarginata]